VSRSTLVTSDPTHRTVFVALSSTIYNFDIQLSDVDRHVYETLSLRVARHPSETAEYLVTRVLAYCLEYVEGITFSKGIAEPDEPAIVVRDLTGALRVWIEVGSPDADRLHKASKAARKVTLYTHVAPALLRREASKRAIHRVDDIEVWRFETSFLDALERLIDRSTRLEIVRTDARLYVTVGGTVLEGDVERVTLGEP